MTSGFSATAQKGKEEKEETKREKGAFRLFYNVLISTGGSRSQCISNV